jgi:hypothetical protein
VHLHALLWLAGGPALFAVLLDGRPVRFGAPLPAAVVASGLHLEGRGTLQWRRLPIGGERADPVWVELAITGPAGTVKVCAGGDGPSADGRGPSFVREASDELLPDGRASTVRWRWVDGSVDERTRTAFTAAATVADEPFGPGEYLTRVSAAFWSRGDVVCRLGRGWATAVGLLPEPGGGGAVTKALRAHVADVLPRLHELPGLRGAGDYGRSGGVVTNGEFDTSLALLHCALGLPDAPSFARAYRAAQHLVDRDIDLRTGLPFVHGLDHRSSAPEPGHCWLQGLLWVGLLAADDELLLAAGNLGHALAAHPPHGTGAQERLRDYAWPLLELEALLAVVDDSGLAGAADRYAESIARRFDPVGHTFRFGEGQLGGGVYLERGWLTGGLLLPALRAHLRRRPDARLAEHVAAVEQMLLERIGKNGQGLPTHWRCAGADVFAEHREEHTAEAAFLLDVLAPVELARLFRRSTVRAAIDEIPKPEDPDLATQLTLLARTSWLWR